jgi:AraC family transcriptional regulator of adaptative response / methylphosphotriester-DNA alkyltransferase methyltransferase
MTGFSEDELWQAVSTNDPSYDGRFYYGVNTTRVFCRPSCKSKQPRRENVAFFASAGEAAGRGYRPCKRCRPDIGPAYQPDRDVIREACLVLEAEYGSPDILDNLPCRVGLSKYHLSRLFKAHTGLTPKAYLQAARVRQAQKLLAGSALSGTEVCFAVGFNSMSSFYQLFRATTGLSPRQYRENRRSCGAGDRDSGEVRHV